MTPEAQFFLTTPRLVLKSHTLANLERLNAWFNDPELSYYDGDDPPLEQPETLEQTRSHLERMISPTDPTRIIHYGIHRLPELELIGYGMIANLDRYHRRCDLGLTLGEKACWGQGYAREALQAVIAYCFDRLEMHRIGASIYAFNQRSIRLFEGLGFEREGVLHQYVWKDAAYQDELIYCLLRPPG